MGTVGAALGRGRGQHRRRAGQPHDPRRRGAHGGHRRRPGARPSCSTTSPAGSARARPGRPTSAPSDLGFGPMRLAVIAGDGIGPEVVAEGLKVLRRGRSRRRDHRLRPRRRALAAHRRAAARHGRSRSCAQHDAILLGAIGDPSVPPGILERGLLLRLRFELDHHVNLRPAKLYRRAWRSPLADARTDRHRSCVREGTEGPYVGNGGVLRKDTPHEVATEVSLNTAFGVERVVRVRVRAGAGPAAQAPDADPQDQRAHPRRRPVVAHGRGGRPPSSRRSPSPTSTSTPRRCSSSPTRAATTSSSPTTSSATSSPTSPPR